MSKIGDMLAEQGNTALLKVKLETVSNLPKKANVGDHLTLEEANKALNIPDLNPLILNKILSQYNTEQLVEAGNQTNLTKTRVNTYVKNVLIPKANEKKLLELLDSSTNFSKGTVGALVTALKTKKRELGNSISKNTDNSEEKNKLKKKAAILNSQIAQHAKKLMDEENVRVAVKFEILPLLDKETLIKIVFNPETQNMSEAAGYLVDTQTLIKEADKRNIDVEQLDEGNPVKNVLRKKTNLKKGSNQTRIQDKSYGYTLNP